MTQIKTFFLTMITIATTLAAGLTWALLYLRG